MASLGSGWREWFYNKFPFFFRNNDTYINAAGEGLFRRFMVMFGEYMEEFEPDWEDYLQNTRDLDECLDDFLPSLAWDLGSPPNPLGTLVGLRRLLHYIVTIYKIKGTLESIQVLLEILGYDVEIIIEYPEDSTWDFQNQDNVNDNPLEWDDFLWDDYCHKCVHYTILLSSNQDDPEEGDYNDISIFDIEEIQDILDWVEPIDAVLDALVHQIVYCEEITLDMDESVFLECFEFEYFDEDNWDEFNWDDAISCGDQTNESGLGEFSNDFGGEFNT